MITEWMVNNKISANGLAASNALLGLRNAADKMGYQFPTTEDGLKALVTLYRAWRPKTDKKNDIPAWQAFQLTVAGIDPADVQPRQISFEDASMSPGEYFDEKAHAEGW